MSIKLFPKLSQNYIELLKDDEYYDITIEVGKDPNVKIFRAHMNILCYRSPYLRRIVASNKKNDGSLSHIKLPNISPENFPIILKYIYGGILSLNEQGTSGILNVLVDTDILCLQELVDCLQNYLIKNKSEWMEENFEITQRVSSKSNNLLKLQQFCTDFIIKSPEKIFKSLYFPSLSEKLLISLIKRDNLKMKEIEIWEHVLKWGLEKNPTLVPDPSTWSDDDFKAMKNILQHLLPSIRFFNLSSKEFSQKIRPYRKLLKNELYEDLLDFYLDPDNLPTNNISLTRNVKIVKIDGKIIDGEIIDSTIINSNIISTISKFIDKVDINDNSQLYLPYKFQLLLRGSRDGFTPKKFHELCDNKPKTITFIKVKGTEEILGGYNPIIWKTSGGWSETKDSFIFSFKNKNDFKDVIISNVVNSDYALGYFSESGPYFGQDLMIWSSNGESTDFDNIGCHKCYYEKMTECGFSIGDYEVFQIIKK